MNVSIIEILFAGVVLWTMWEFFQLLEDTKKQEREYKLNNKEKSHGNN